MTEPQNVILDYTYFLGHHKVQNYCKFYEGFTQVKIMFIDKKCEKRASLKQYI